MTESRLRAIVFGCLLIAGSSIAWACNVPVFRYALDHWSPDPYRAIVVSRGVLSERDQARLEALKSATEKQKINLLIKYLDISSQPAGELPKSLLELPEEAGAHLLVHYPSDLNIAEPIMSSSLQAIEPMQLVGSPARTELLKRLADGQSAVWMFLASGDEAADLTARTTLESELRGLESSLELPKLTDDPEDAIKGGPALRIAFSLIEVKPDDKEEWALRSMLLGSEPDLKELKEPMAFPVFGRGRALWPLVGAGINADNVRESATFVVGACSCQVKEQNPGFDLLINADWDELLPWTKAIESSHNLGANVQVAETIPIPVGSNMTNELIAMGVGLGTTASDSAPPPVVQTGDTSLATILIIAVVAICIIALSAYLLGRSKKATA